MSFLERNNDEVRTYTHLLRLYDFAEIKRTMFIFWHESVENTPIIVKKCLESWKYYNPTWDIVIMDMTSYSNYIDEKEVVQIKKMFRIEKIEMTKFTDVLRLFLLHRNGGLWVDATCFCNCPLDDWLPNYIEHGFFVFDNLTRLGKKTSNWFIYSEPNNYMIRMRKKGMLKVHTENPAKFHKTYFMMHDVFDELYDTNRIFSDIFDNVLKTGQNDHDMYFDLQKKGNLYIKNNGFLEPLTPRIRDMIVNKEKYLFKLSHKCDYPDVLHENTILAFLFSTVGNQGYYTFSHLKRRINIFSVGF